MLNLPEEVTFTNGSSIKFFYSAEGEKLRTVYTISGAISQKDYCGNIVYESGVQKYLLNDEGYYDLASGGYHYYLKDHLGNNRVVINQSGTVEQTNHYYPYGGMFASTSTGQPYRYNGKEYDTHASLNWYDYGARHYDPAIARWTTQDPLAEKYYGWNQYGYCVNNPLKFIDINGMDTVFVLDQATRPNDNYRDENYTATIIVYQNGKVNGKYRGSSYPNSKSEKDNGTVYNTIKEGEYPYNNMYGHKAGSQKGLNLVNEQGERKVPGYNPKGEEVQMSVVNVHSGFSTVKGPKSRGSEGCITIHPDDAVAFFSHFKWNKENQNTGYSTGKIIISRNPEEYETFF